MGIQLQNDFSVAAPINEVWALFQDPQKVAPCLPGAELTEVVNPNHFKGRVKIKMGPVALSIKGELHVLSRNASSHTVVMKGTGGEEKGKGQAEANVTATMIGSGNTTSVKIVQDITVSGAMAQYGRGMMGDVVTVLMNQFAKCLGGVLSGKGASAPKAASGFGIAAASTAVGMKRLFGGGKK